MLAASSIGFEEEHKSCSIMALLDGGTLRRHKSWLKVGALFCEFLPDIGLVQVVVVAPFKVCV